MRSFIVVLAAFATAVAAQGQGLPPCAGSCVTSDFGGCGGLNVTCICSNKPLIDGLACCVSTACDAQQQQDVINFANALCGSSGVTDLPQSATCASGTRPTGSVVPGSSSASASDATTTGSSASSTGTGSVSPSSTGSAATSAAPSASPTGAASRIEAAVFGVGALVFGALAAL
ncbi:hypothetical protein KVT40_009110 [Elsinoe batatas]|uniref:CFEM domain-containing protein n=1 Tax=Elsinoe batatas TaxID=2601811 RepID=A0A8K0PG19_9PEZI|nr:hypothetical protein KVT40_009110 [Elsinoe batatas]